MYLETEKRTLRSLLRRVGARRERFGRRRGRLHCQDVRQRCLPYRWKSRDTSYGGMGFTWENDLHLYYRRAKASETMLGDANVSSRADRSSGDLMMVCRRKGE